MPRPKGYKLSEEAKQRIGAASRAKWELKRLKNNVQTAGNMTERTEILNSYLENHQTQTKKKWWEFWKWT